MESPPSQPLRENRPSYPAVKCRLVVSHDSILTVRTGIGRVFVEVLRQADEGGRSRFRRLVLVMLNPHRRLTDSMPAMCLHVYRSRTTPIVIVERLRLDPNPMAPRASRGFVARILKDWQLDQVFPFTRRGAPLRDIAPCFAGGPPSRHKYWTARSRPLRWSCAVEELTGAVQVVVMDHVGLACLPSFGEDALATRGPGLGPWRAFALVPSTVLPAWALVALGPWTRRRRRLDTTSTQKKESAWHRKLRAVQARRAPRRAPGVVPGVVPAPGMTRASSRSWPRPSGGSRPPRSAARSGRAAARHTRLSPSSCERNAPGSRQTYRGQRPSGPRC